MRGALQLLGEYLHEMRIEGGIESKARSFVQREGYIQQRRCRAQMAVAAIVARVMGCPAGGILMVRTIVGGRVTAVLVRLLLLLHRQHGGMVVAATRHPDRSKPL